MRLLADENFPGAAVGALRAAGHDVLWVRMDAPGLADRDVLARAVAEARTLLTLDKDFGELAFRARLPARCGVVLIRTVGGKPSDVRDLALRLIGSGIELAEWFTVVDGEGVRRRRMP